MSEAPTITPTTRARRRYRLDPSERRDFPLRHIPQALAVLEACDQRALLTNGQLSRLLFEGQPNAHGEIRALPAAEKAAAKALHRLWEGGFLERRPVILTSRRTGGPYHHYVNVLAARGAEELGAVYAERGRGELRWKGRVELSAQTIEHALAINDAYVLLRRGCDLIGARFGGWRDDRQLSAMTRAKQLSLTAIPDACFLLGPADHPRACFLEIDLGTESVSGERSRRIWRDKVAAHARYLREGFADDEYFAGVAAPTVLTITTGTARLERMLAATREIGGGAMFWYTTIEAITPEREVELAGAAGGAARCVPFFQPQSLWEPVWRVASDAIPRSLIDLTTA